MAEDVLVVVGTFNSRPEAELARSALEAAGIESIVVSDDAGGEYPGLWEGRGVTVVVNRENEGEARAVLTECTEKTETEDTESTE